MYLKGIQVQVTRDWLFLISSYEEVTLVLANNYLANYTT